MSQSLSHSLQVILLRNPGKLSSASLSFFYHPRCMFSLFLLCLPTVLLDQLFVASFIFTSAQITTSPAFVSARTGTWHVLKNMKDSLHFLTCEPNHTVCFSFSSSSSFRKASYYYFSGFIHTQNEFSWEKKKTLFCLFVNTRLVFIFPRDAVNKQRQDESKAKQRADNTNVAFIHFIHTVCHVRQCVLVKSFICGLTPAPSALSASNTHLKRKKKGKKEPFLALLHY